MYLGTLNDSFRSFEEKWKLFEILENFQLFMRYFVLFSKDRKETFLSTQTHFLVFWSLIFAILQFSIPGISPPDPAPAPWDSMGCGRMELPRPSGRTGRAIDALGYYHKPAYRPGRSGDRNSDGIVVELWPTQLEFYFLCTEALSGRDL